MKFLMFHSNKIKLILILFLWTLIPNVSALVKPTSEFFINDYADILTKETEDYIYSKSEQLENVDKTQFVVVTVKNMEGKDINTYALELFRSFGIGDEEKNNGVLILFALEERDIRVEVGAGLEGILNDAKVGRFLDDYAMPYFKNNNFDIGIKNVYDAIFNEIVKQNNLDLSTNAPAVSKSSGLNDMHISVFMICVAISYITASIFKNFSKWYIYSIVYLASLYVGFCLYMPNSIAKLYLICFIIHVCGYLKGDERGGRYHSGGYRSSGSSHHSSGSSHSGGGGTSHGGGASRHF